jgi:short subunit dehydrogenase-like uncharacterized protein
LPLANNQPTISLDFSESYHGSNRRPSFAMADIVATTFHADGLRRSEVESYVRKSVVVVDKNSPCQVDLVVWALFRIDLVQ